MPKATCSSWALSTRSQGGLSYSLPRQQRHWSQLRAYSNIWDASVHTRLFTPTVEQFFITSLFPKYCDITAHTVLLYVLFCLTHMYRTYCTSHVSPVSHVEVSSSTYVLSESEHILSDTCSYIFTSHSDHLISLA